MGSRLSRCSICVQQRMWGTVSHLKVSRRLALQPREP